MKKIITIAAVALLMISAVQVKAQKLGHLNVQEVMLAMPERIAIEEDVKKFRDNLQTTFQTMSGEYQQKLLVFQNLEEGTPQSVREAHIQDIQGTEERMKNFETTAQQDLQNKEQELLTPMLEKVQAAIKAIAESGGFTYIFDSGVGVLVHAGGTDVAPLVKKQLGITE